MLEDIGLIWGEATLEEEKQIVHTLLEAVYLDSEDGPVVSVEPKVEFRVLFELASEASLVVDAEPGRTKLEEVARGRDRDVSRDGLQSKDWGPSLLMVVRYLSRLEGYDTMSVESLGAVASGYGPSR